MADYPVIRDLDDIYAHAADELLLVSAADLREWVRHARAPEDARAEERDACRKIVEDHLRLLLEERDLNPVLLIQGMVDRIDARGGGTLAAQPKA